MLFPWSNLVGGRCVRCHVPCAMCHVPRDADAEAEDGAPVHNCFAENSATQHGERIWQWTGFQGALLQMTTSCSLSALGP
ncbi:MAG: hypothetical protein ACI9NG_000323 [Hyphomonas sp.]|jgi:hypothetical protein